MSNSNTRLKTFKYRLYPSRSQAQNLGQVMACARNLYNMLLAERKYAYQLEGRSVSRAELEQLAKHYRATFPYAQQLFSQTAQSLVKQVEDAFQAFFRRVKAGEKPGYPRFKGSQHFHSFLFKQYGAGAKLEGRRLKLFGIGRVRVRWHRPLEGKIKTVRILHKAGHWFVCFTCEVSPPLPLPKTGHSIGIDVGLNALLTTSTGEQVSNPRWYRAAQAELRRKQRQFARAHKGSQQRKKKLLIVQRQHEHVKNQRQDFLDKLVYDLIHSYDVIAIEDLKISNMVKNHHLSKSILDAGWGYFKQRLLDKAADAGREVVLVDPAYTSKTCSNCGGLFEGLTLAQRWVDCACGLSLDRDHNAALNILKRAGRVREP